MKPNEFNTYKKLYSKTQSNMKSGDFRHFKAFYERVRGEPWREGKNSQKTANKGSERDRLSVTNKLTPKKDRKFAEFSDGKEI